MTIHGVNKRMPFPSIPRPPTLPDQFTGRTDAPYQRFLFRLILCFFTHSRQTFSSCTKETSLTKNYDDDGEKGFHVPLYHLPVSTSSTSNKGYSPLWTPLRMKKRDARVYFWMSVCFSLLIALGIRPTIALAVWGQWKRIKSISWKKVKDSNLENPQHKLQK